MEKYLHIDANEDMKGLADVISNVRFSEVLESGLYMTLILPQKVARHMETGTRRPLIVFLQGSGWTFPNINFQLSQLAHFAQQGYIVATITHRNSKEVHPFPAYLQDAKTAVRFLRAHAEEYCIDPDRICFWGTSSGGNTALLMGLTPDDPRYRTDEYAEFSDRIHVVVDCCGPSDMLSMPQAKEGVVPPLALHLIGSGDPHQVTQEMSPLYHINEVSAYPPTLLAHGTEDPLVPFEQSQIMYDRLLEAGCDATMIRVEGAPHGDSLWGPELYSLIEQFLEEHL